MALIRNNRLLWTLQGLLAALFLFAGTMKFIMPADQMTAGSPLPVEFFYFIGVMEILGAIGLIVPRLTGIRPGLTPLAAAGLIVIMIGATAITVATMGVLPALLPFVTGLLLIVVARGRREGVTSAAAPATPVAVRHG
jgi:uncharacterized membrane protein